MIRDIKKEVITALNQLSHVGVIDDEAMVALAGIFSNEVDTWRTEIVSEINRQIASWEEGQGSNDGTLFTLGLRRSRDLILGSDSLEDLPVLEQVDTLLDEGEDG